MSEDNTGNVGNSYLPSSWDNAFGLFKYSRSVIGLNLSTVFILVIGNALVSLVLQLAFSRVGVIISYILDALFLGALTHTYLEGVKGKTVELGDALSVGVKNWLNFIVLGISLGVVLIISFVLLIVPFLIVFPRLVLSPYFMLDQDLSPFDAIRASWDKTKGHSLQIGQVILLSALFALLMIVIIGIYFYIAYSAAFAIFYTMLKKKKIA